ncbi:Semialdehyde dehydrogenase NAD-binding domain-containing protein [Plasmodiophora brassicae]
MTVEDGDGRPRRRTVAILGATGLVGQRFVERLADHPWFELVAVGASSRSAGQTYARACSWKLDTALPDAVSEFVVRPCVPREFEGVQIIFSALDSSVAGDIESEFANAGFAVFTNAGPHRMDADVPVLIPFVNPDHLEAAFAQSRASKNGRSGFIIANANCASTGLVVALRPLQQAFGIDSALVVTMQAVSGAGYPGVPAMDIVDNVVPYIPGEEDKLESEPLKILGEWRNGAFRPAEMTLSAQCNRVCVRDGHLACCSVKLRRPATADEVRDALSQYESPVAQYKLPSAPASPIVVLSADDRPQPRLDRDCGRGYTITVGRVRACTLLDVKFTLLSHNTVIGAAGGSLLNAELAVARGLA